MTDGFCGLVTNRQRRVDSQPESLSHVRIDRQTDWRVIRVADRRTERRRGWLGLTCDFLILALNTVTRESTQLSSHRLLRQRPTFPPRATRKVQHSLQNTGDPLFTDHLRNQAKVVL